MKYWMTYVIVMPILAFIAWKVNKEMNVAPLRTKNNN